jgi:hypothetical protein
MGGIHGVLISDKLQDLFSFTRLVTGHTFLITLGLQTQITPNSFVHSYLICQIKPPPRIQQKIEKLTTAVEDIDKKAPTNTPSDGLAPQSCMRNSIRYT